LQGEDTSAVIVLNEKVSERDSGERRGRQRERERERRCVLWLTRVARSHSLLTDEPSVEAESSAVCVKLRGERNMNIMRTFPRLLSDTGQKKTPEKKDGRRMSFQRPKGTIEYSVSENIKLFPRYFCACAFVFCRVVSRGARPSSVYSEDFFHMCRRDFCESLCASTGMI